MTKIPQAVSESVLTVCGQTIRVAQLEDGRRMLVADDVEHFFAVGGDQQRLADAVELDLLRHDRDELLKEVELFAEIARIESPGTQLGGWDWKGMYELLTALISRILEENGE